MVYITHLVVSLFLLVGSPFGISSGLSISSRDLKLSPQLLSSLSSGTSSTERPISGIDNIKTQFVNTEQHEESSSSSPVAAHHVPLDTAPGSRSSSNSNNSKTKTVSVVKREVSSSTDEEEGKLNGIYDPGMMIMSKRSAAALNKLMLALRSFDEPSSSGSYENEQGGSTKEVNTRFPKTGFHSGGSGLNFGSTQQYALQRRGQKDRKIYLRCYFNAVSCFRRRRK